MIGVLALQGGFELHTERLTQLHQPWALIKHPTELAGVNGLILPGGESSVFLKLASQAMRDEICRRIEEKMPVFATCAGLIFLAHDVAKPAQSSLDLIDVDVERNAYGRQVDSFIDSHLRWTPAARRLLRRVSPTAADAETTEGVFIRAPRITRVGETVSVLAERNGEPVLVRNDSVIAATFHPELSTETTIHELFAALCAGIA